MTTGPDQPHRRGIIRALAAATVLPVPLSVATAAAAEPGRTDADMVTDWPWLGRYAADNAARLAAGTTSDAVFIGDSNTEHWARLRPGYFPPSRVNRGISGQTTPQILLRMMADVVALRPRLVHIMAGTNDVAGNTGPMSVEATIDNLAAMAAIARANGIIVILATVPPAARFFWRPQVEPVAAIADINRRIASIGDGRDIIIADYFPLLADSGGAMRAEFTGDGVHPNDRGYAVMEGLLDPLLARIGRSRRHSPSRRCAAIQS